MMELLDLIKAKVAALLAGVTYTTPSGAQAVPSLHIGALPPKRSQVDQDQDFPFVVIRPLAGSEDRSQGQVSVRLICGAYDSDGVESGVAAVIDLTDRLLDLAADKSYTPWALQLPLEWRHGDDKDGNQPTPFYFLTIDLHFKHTPRV